jgi:hypothetical protein
MTEQEELPNLPKTQKEIFHEYYLRAKQKREPRYHARFSIAKHWKRLQDYYEEIRNYNKAHPDFQLELPPVPEYFK